MSARTKGVVIGLVLGVAISHLYMKSAAAPSQSA